MFYFALLLCNPRYINYNLVASAERACCAAYRRLAQKPVAAIISLSPEKPAAAHLHAMQGRDAAVQVTLSGPYSLLGLAKSRVVGAESPRYANSLKVGQTRPCVLWLHIRAPAGGSLTAGGLVRCSGMSSISQIPADMESTVEVKSTTAPDHESPYNWTTKQSTLRILSSEIGRLTDDRTVLQNGPLRSRCVSTTLWFPSERRYSRPGSA